MTDTHTRQEAGSPQGIGGQFKATARTEPKSGLTGDVAVARQRTADSAVASMHADQRALEGPIRRADKSALHALDTSILASHPQATTATFERHWGSDTWKLSAIADASGQELGDHPDVSEILELLHGRPGESTSRNARSVEVERATLQLGTTEGTSFQDMTRDEAGALISPVLTRLGTVGGTWDLTEAHYRLDEGAGDYGFDETVWPKMLAKFGDEEKALEALWGTRAYQALDEDIPDYATMRFTERLTQAVEELDL